MATANEALKAAQFRLALLNDRIAHLESRWSDSGIAPDSFGSYRRAVEEASEVEKEIRKIKAEVKAAKAAETEGSDGI